MVRTANQRAGFHVPEPQGQAFIFDQPELPRQIEPHHRPMGLGGLEVLPDRDDRTSGRAQVPHDRAHFVQRLAETDPTPR